jgi:hypothetical protein
MTSLSDIVAAITSSPLFLGLGNDLVDKVAWDASPGINMQRLFLKPTASVTANTPMEIACFDLAAQISHQRFKLLPDAGWRESFGKTLEGQRAAALLVRPRTTELLPAWDGVLNGIQILQDSKAIGHAPLGHVIINPLYPDGDQRAVRARHQLFCVCTRIFNSSKLLLIYSLSDPG